MQSRLSGYAQMDSLSSVAHERAKAMTGDNDYTEHLRQAEERIADALRRIEQHEARMRTRRLSDEERERATALLRSMQSSLELFRMHRDSIARLIAVRGPRGG